MGREHIVSEEILKGNKRAFIGGKYRDSNVNLPIALFNYPEFGRLSLAAIILSPKLSMYAVKSDSGGTASGEGINDGKSQLRCIRIMREYGDVMETLNELMEVGMAQLDTEDEQVKELRLNWAFQTTA